MSNYLCSNYQYFQGKPKQIIGFDLLDFKFDISESEEKKLLKVAAIGDSAVGD